MHKGRSFIRAGIAAALVVPLLLVGCAGKQASAPDKPAAEAPKGPTPENPAKLVFAVAGGACEAPIYAAKEKGIFAKHGLDVELKTFGFDELKTGLATGKVNAVVGNLEWVKPVEEGIDIKFVQGIHRGCIRGVAKKGLNIKSPADLKGHVVGTNGIADYPDVLAQSSIAAAGLDPQKDVKLKAYPGAELPLALKKGEIDAFIMWDPIPTQYLAENPGSTVWFDNMVTEPFNQGYCCMLSVSGGWAAENPEVVKALSDAVSEGTEYVGLHPQEVAKIEVEKKYVAGDEAQIAERLASYGWEPSVERGKESTKILIGDLAKLGLLNDETDPAKLIEQIYYSAPQ